MCYRFLLRDSTLLWLALVVMGLAFRPLTPVDETRAVSVAWEMWQRHDFLVPYLNGEPYSHKPPLLQWCIHLMWSLFGVQEWCARMVVPLFALANLVLTSRLARLLWAEDRVSARLVPWLLLGMPLWAMWTSLTLYDMLITFCTLLGLNGIAQVAQGDTRRGWSLTGIAIGTGILAKGPVILLLILPAALLAPWWQESRPEAGWKSWYLGVLAAVLLGAAIGLTWAIPAGFSGGEEYRRLIFWGQSAGRIAHSFAHQRPFWWYTLMLPALLFPWVVWPPLLRALKQVRLEQGLRLCISHTISVFILFSFISGKQAHYLLPVFPAVALWLARTLTRSQLAVSRADQRWIGLLILLCGLVLALTPVLAWALGSTELSKQLADIGAQAPLMAKVILIGCGALLLWWQPHGMRSAARSITLAVIGMLLATHLVYRQVGWHYYDMQPFAERLGEAQRRGGTIVHWRKYSGDFNFLGRLERPLQEIGSKDALTSWIKDHPQDYVVLIYRPGTEALEKGAIYAQDYRGSRRITLWQSSMLIAVPDRLEKLLD